MSATEFDVMARAEEIRGQRLEALGLREQYDLWRESLPNEQSISNAEAYSLFLEAQGVEQAATDGRLSVSSGGEDEAPATTPPTPGPDDEEGGTDEAGDVSEGPIDGTPIPETDVDEEGRVKPREPERDTELKPVEGMWVPPLEAEALNYDPPSTTEMTSPSNSDWMENAKAFYKFMGSPDLIMGGGLPGPIAEQQRKLQPDLPPTSDADIAEWAKRQIGSFNWNVAVMMSYAHKLMTSEDPKAALAFMNLLNMYDHSSGGAGEFSLAIANLMGDPTTYSGLGVGQVAARGAAKALAKSELKKKISMAIVGGTAGTIEGSMLAGGYNLTVQNIEQEAGMRKDIDRGQAAMAGLAGAGLGLLLGGAGGHLVGRHIDKLAGANEKRIADLIASKLLAEERAVEDIPLDQIEEFLQKEIVKDAETGRKSDTAEMLLRYIQEEREVPRLADGSIDEERLAAEIKKYHDRTLPPRDEVGAKISDNDRMNGEIEIEYDVLADDETTAKVYAFFDEMEGLYDDSVDFSLRFEEDKAKIRAVPREDFQSEYPIAEMIHEEWELREKFGIKGGLEEAEALERAAGEASLLGRKLEKYTDQNQNWNIDSETGDVYYSDPDLDYGPLQELADQMGIEHHMVRINEDNTVFMIKNEDDPRAFMNELKRVVDGGQAPSGAVTGRLIDKWNQRVEDFFGEPSETGPAIEQVEGGLDVLVENYNDQTGPEFQGVLDEIGKYARITHQVSMDSNKIEIRGDPGEIQRFLEIESALRDTVEGLGVSGFVLKRGKDSIDWTFDPIVGTRTAVEDHKITKNIIEEITTENKMDVEITERTVDWHGYEAERMSVKFANELDRERFRKLWEDRFSADERTIPEKIKDIAMELPRAGSRETIIEGRRGGAPLTPEEGLARGLSDEDIAKLELDPVNVADKLERAGFKVMMGEEGDILFFAEDMSPATSERIQRVADETGVTAKGDAFPEKGGEVIAAVVVSGDPVDMARFGAKMAGEVQPAKLPMAESKELARRIAEIEKSAKREVIAKSASLPGSHVRDATGAEFEVMGRTKNGWFHLKNKLTGEEVNRRRNQFEVIESHPAPEKAGPMELAPFTKNAAKIMAMNEDVVSGKLEGVKVTIPEQESIVKELREMGIKIDKKKLATYWTPAELLYLRDTYNAMANGMLELGSVLARELKNSGKLSDESLAMFNEAHTTFVATRDLFFGVSGNAARQLHILKTRPKDDVYEFSQGLLDSISIAGGRSNTERAIKIMAKIADGEIPPGKTKIGQVTKASDSIWGNKVASWFLQTRYNMMLSSWRTHFFNWFGNSASGFYQFLMVNPVKMGINNAIYAANVARGVLDPKYIPDPADRMTLHQWWAPIRAQHAAFQDSLILAKEIALGHDIGEGKVWNELGLRYNVVNVPTNMFAKLGTTPVRLLEAGDAFFKNQYYMAKIHELASVKARYDEIHGGLNFKTQYHKYTNEPDAPMMRQAKEYAAMQTYTNDPSVYGGVFAALARGAAAAQNRSIIVNMIVPFVRTPANLMMKSMEMIGVNQVMSAPNTYNQLVKGTASESQEAMAKIVVAAGIWLTVYELYQNGLITGTGPENWEERKVWEAAGWQANSIQVNGKWYDISRADPAGQSLVSIASVFDYYAMTQQQNKDMGEWIGAGLLYTADMIVDESYLSTASDVITAIQSKEEARARSVTASLINSVVVPNLLRDIRAPADPEVRSARSENLVDQVVKQMKNASPWNSNEIPSGRDWKGDILNRYGNAYQRGLIPFKIRDPMDSDPASMALAYARIPPPEPNRTIEWPKGNGDAINLFPMDGGNGFVYDKYLEIVGKARLRAVTTAMNTNAWKRMVRLDNNGPGSDGENVLRRALAVGSHIGRLQMLDWLIDHHGDNAQFRRGNGDLILIEHPVSVSEYIRLRREVRRTDTPLDVTEFPQYQIEHRKEGPEFFKPRTPE